MPIVQLSFTWFLTGLRLPIRQDRFQNGLIGRFVIPASFRHPDFSSPSEPTLTVRLRRGDASLSFFTTVTTFNAPQNVTLEELRIEGLPTNVSFLKTILADTRYRNNEISTAFLPKLMAEEGLG